MAPSLVADLAHYFSPGNDFDYGHLSFHTLFANVAHLFACGSAVAQLTAGSIEVDEAHLDSIEGDTASSAFAAVLGYASKIVALVVDRLHCALRIVSSSP